MVVFSEFYVFIHLFTYIFSDLYIHSITISSSIISIFALSYRIRVCFQPLASDSYVGRITRQSFRYSMFFSLFPPYIFILSHVGVRGRVKHRSARPDLWQQGSGGESVMVSWKQARPTADRGRDVYTDVWDAGNRLGVSGSHDVTRVT